MNRLLPYLFVLAVLAATPNARAGNPWAENVQFGPRDRVRDIDRATFFRNCPNCKPESKPDVAPPSVVPFVAPPAPMPEPVVMPEPEIEGPSTAMVVGGMVAGVISAVVGAVAGVAVQWRKTYSA